jgi:PAS domain S-box-containing protein
MPLNEGVSRPSTPAGVNDDPDLSEIIDHEALQLLMDDFFRLTGAGSAIVDMRGTVLVAGGWQDICTRFHRVHPVTQKYCTESDTALTSGTAPGEVRLYQCKNGMWDVATPIHIGGKQIGNVFFGQFFFDDEAPDREHFRRQAARYGFDVEAYLAALARVPRWSRQEVDRIMAFYARLAAMIAVQGYTSLRLARALAAHEGMVATLRASEERYRSLVEGSPNCVALLDGEGRYIQINRRGLEVWGREENDVLGRRFAEGWPVRTRPVVDKAIGNSLQGEACSFEADCVGLDGEPARWWVALNPVRDHEGVVTHLVVVSMDVTERRRLEYELLQLKKSESLGRMAGAVAHLYNNLMGVVLGNLELAGDPAAVPGEAARMTADARSAAERAAEISRLMLAYLGQSAGTRRALDLGAACREALAGNGTPLPHNVRLDIALPPRGPVVRADAAQMRQVLDALVTNAREGLGEKGGKIAVGAGDAAARDVRGGFVVPADWQPADSRYAYLSVSDTGVGMTPESLERSFDPFFSTKFTGRGLGLPVVLGIARAHDGAVSVDSRPGAGTVVRVYLPLTDEEPAELPSAGSPVRPVEGEGLVLVVDDEPGLLNLAQVMLRSLGYEGMVASSGTEAVEIFRRRSREIRCVFCDLTMPGMNGWETLAALRRIRPDVPAVLCSGHDEASVMADTRPDPPRPSWASPTGWMRSPAHSAGRWEAGT